VLTTKAFVGSAEGANGDGDCVNDESFCGQSANGDTEMEERANGHGAC